MPSELAAWLREQRENRGWARSEMARRLIKAGEAAGDRSLPGLDSMCHNLYRWERGTDNPSERYRLYYSRALGIPPSQLGLGRHDGHASTWHPSAGIFSPRPPGMVAEVPAAGVLHVTPGRADPSAPKPGAIAYRGVWESELGDLIVEREVLMAAHEGSEQAEHAEERGIGDTSLEQFRADVIRLSLEFPIGDPLPLFLEMRRVRGRMHDALDRRMWPRDATELYLMLGALNDLMGLAAYDLGYPQAAEELLRAGWVYAIAIDHNPLKALLRLGFASILAGQQPQRCGQYADDGLRYVSVGPTAAALHLYRARAAARLGEVDTAQQAIADASGARELEHHDEILDMGGEFAVSRATHHCYAGWALLEIPDTASEAAAELERATELYMHGPEPGETHGFGVEALTRVNLATARLRLGAIDAAVDALQPVLSLPVQNRILDLPQRLTAVRAELAAPIFRGSVPARALNEQVEEFGRDTIVSSLHSLAGGAG